MREDIVPGAPFPDYRLPDHTGAERSLSELQGDDPMVLVLSRGHYCPKDNQQHLELAGLQSKMAVAYTKLLTISTDDQMASMEYRAAVGATWPFLSDVERVVQQDLDIAEYTDPVHNPMVPHTLVLAPGLEVASVYCGYYFWGRPSADDLWRDLRRVFAAVKPDFDPTTAEARAAWERKQQSG